MARYDLKSALDEAFALLNATNLYMNITKPWEQFSSLEENRKSIRDALYTGAHCLKTAAIMLFPFFPEKMGELFARIGLDAYPSLLDA